MHFRLLEFFIYVIQKIFELYCSIINYYEFCLHVKIFINHNNFFLKMKDTIYTHYNNFGKLK